MANEPFDINAAQQNLEMRRKEFADTKRKVVPAEAISPVVTEQPEIELCPQHRLAAPCQICAEIAEERRQQKKRRAIALFNAARIGRRYQDMTFADYIPTCSDAAKVKASCERYAATFPERLKNGDSLVFYGNPGTGKNMLAACICRGVTMQGFSALHTTGLKLVRAIRDSWRRNSDEPEQTAIDRFTDPDILVIDEIGRGFGSASEQNILFEVFNNRYEEKKPTIILTNLSLKETENYLGPSTADRFYEGYSAMLHFSWESYRRREPSVEENTCRASETRGKE